MTKRKPKSEHKRDGRPTKYRDAFVKQAKKLCELGATNPDLAEFFEVSLNTIDNWAAKHPQFLGALKVGKGAADDRVERSLYQKATGYEVDTVKIFMPAGADEPVYAPYREKVPPSDTAAIFWLKNRRGAEWRDKQEIDHTVKVTGIEMTFRKPGGDG